jgi:hypothetical protein
MSGPIAGDVVHALSGSIDAAFSGALQVPTLSIILLINTLLSCFVAQKVIEQDRGCLYGSSRHVHGVPVEATFSAQPAKLATKPQL